MAFALGKSDGGYEGRTQSAPTIGAWTMPTTATVMVMVLNFSGARYKLTGRALYLSGARSDRQTRLMTDSTSPARYSTITALQARMIQQSDFLLLLTLFLFFRFCSVFFLRPGGYTRDYTDLIYYQGRASWQDFDLLPYRDYWSEYPPLFAWLSLGIDQLSRRIPLWEDERLWFAAIFGIITVLAETVTLVCLYWLARRLYGERAIRVAWIYMGLFLPVYFLAGWYDALPVATVWLGLALLIARPDTIGALLAGLTLGVGGALKLAPLAVLASTPLSTPRWLPRIVAGGAAVAVVVVTYLWAYLHGPVMTLTSIRSLVDRTGWSTLYAWVNHYTRLGKVLGDVFDPNARIAQYDSIYSESLVLAAWLALGAIVLILLWRRQTAPHPPRTVVAFMGFTYLVLLLSYPSWNPQYVLYLLPFVALLWPSGRGVAYALALMFLTLLEHPIYHNLIGPDYAPTIRRLIDFDYRQLFLAIIIARTVVLVALGIDLLSELFVGWRRFRWLPVAMAGLAVAGIVLLLPQFGRAYAAGRLATSPVRPLARLVNALPTELPIVAQSLPLGRGLGPLLDQPERLHLFGGRPGRIEPLPALAERSPFLYIRTGDDDPALAEQIEARYHCPTRWPLRDWELWFCHDATVSIIAQFEQGIELVAATTPQNAGNPIQVTLFWRTTEPIAQEYTVFVHVVDANGKMVGQWDQAPGAGESPTTNWEVGRLIVDEYQVPLTLADSTPPYRILTGLYEPASGDRLSVLQSTHPVSDGRLEIATLEAR
jgi:hypothetical protein